MPYYHKNCENCRNDFHANVATTRPPPRFCSKSCATSVKNKGNHYNYGRMKPGLEATESPTVRDIAWAAGWFDGEGSIAKRRANSQQCHMGQKDRWVLDRFKALFGGSIVERQMNGQPFFEWHISGARCRGFLMTLYTFFSPRRQERIGKVL